jgi:hypothetical protein
MSPPRITKSMVRSSTTLVSRMFCNWTQLTGSPIAFGGGTMLAVVEAPPAQPATARRSPIAGVVARMAQSPTISITQHIADGRWQATQHLLRAIWRPVAERWLNPATKSD